jgi:hypothetical protein
MTKQTPQDVLGTNASPVSVANNASSSLSSALDVTAAIGIMLQVKATTGIAVFQTGATLSVYNSPDNVNFDTIPYVTAPLAFSSASTSFLMSVAIPYAEDVAYLKVMVTTNNTASATATTFWVQAQRITP